MAGGGVKPDGSLAASDMVASGAGRRSHQCLPAVARSRRAGERAELEDRLSEALQIARGETAVG